MSRFGYFSRCAAGLMILALAVLVGFSVPNARAQSVINEVLVEGNERIEADTVRSYLSTAVGDVFDAREINDSLKGLFATGLFADVTIRREGQALIVRVVENPIINRVAFEGNQRIDDEALEAETQLRARVVYTRTRVQSDVQRLIEVYRRSGRFAAQIEPKVIQLAQNRVDLVFEIDEGPLTGVRRISFVGNKRFDDGYLRDEIQTRESAWWRILTSDDTYDPDRLTFDRELLRKFYLSRGYADFRVISAVAELTRDRKDFYVTFTIEEGERYRFGNLSINSKLRDLNAASLLPALTTTSDDWYDADEVEDSIQALTDSVGNLGYAFVDIRPRIKRDREQRLIDVTYEIDEGPRVYVQRIDIIGNVRTLDKVIRREFRLVEGDAFNAAKIRRSRQNIRNLGLFEEVRIDSEQGEQPDQSILTVAVAEKSTGELSFGAGISTLDGFLGDVSIRERNLLGRGQDLRLGLTFSTRRQEIDLNFTEPYFLDRDIAAGFDVFRKNVDFQDESSFDQDTLGSSLRANYTVAEDLRHGVVYTLRQDKISNVDDDASRIVKDQEGTSTTSSLGHTLTLDKRDSRIKPTEGFMIQFGQEGAGLGGDVHYLKHTLTYTYHWPFWSNLIANASLKEGYIVGLGEDVRINDRFFLGGSNLRGFVPGGVGPRDRNTGDSLGGNMFYAATAEVTVPLNLTKDLDVDGALFADVGALSDIDDTGSDVLDSGKPRASIGVGVSYASPFGPIRIDYARAVKKESFDETENFRFSFGARF
ncbi:MAG: outer membrane protein assembly factor BamA [Rhodospirillaceae bacterium]|nr:outer membrane protein assembly factor BamA [Rhodospirillaceae bacterium]MBT5677232.1 outer membrane protein assembly factor BamA [Rhodospirillaceae bacterium]MBT7293902.1 outer membrane protein assembly factor BamA [Rhodospirillaceae bacterium]